MPIGLSLITEYFHCDRGSSCMGSVFVCFVFTFTSVVNTSLLVSPFNGSHVTFPASIHCGTWSIWGGMEGGQAWGVRSSFSVLLVQVSLRWKCCYFHSSRYNNRRAPSTMPGTSGYPVCLLSERRNEELSKYLRLDFSKGPVWGDTKCFFLEREQKQPGWFGNLALCQPALHPWNQRPSFPPQVESLAKYKVIYRPYSRAELEPSVRI